MTISVGTPQGDILVKGMLDAGIEEMRRNPWLLDFALGWVTQDALTEVKYGAKDLAAAKKWFLRTKVPVQVSDILSPPTMPCITVEILEGKESRNTLGDIHYEPSVEDDRLWPILAGPFNPTSYDPLTRTLTLPTSVTDALVVTAGQVVVAGNEILTIQSVDGNKVVLAATARTDFTDALIRGIRPTARIALRSIGWEESYRIGCHASTNMAELSWLYSIVLFVILRGRDSLLNDRGLQSTSIQASGPQANPSYEGGEVYTRTVMLNGTYMLVWPAETENRIYASGIQPTISAEGYTGATTGGADDPYLVSGSGW